ncbi:MAG: hypothetical protein WAN65_13380 [Candidatus Sulfotelmatobacter sp.]
MNSFTIQSHQRLISWRNDGLHSLLLDFELQVFDDGAYDLAGVLSGARRSRPCAAYFLCFQQPVHVAVPGHREGRSGGKGSKVRYAFGQGESSFVQESVNPVGSHGIHDITKVTVATFKPAGIWLGVVHAQFSLILELRTQRTRDYLEELNAELQRDYIKDAQDLHLAFLDMVDRILERSSERSSGDTPQVLSEMPPNVSQSCRREHPTRTSGDPGNAGGGDGSSVGN